MFKAFTKQEQGQHFKPHHKSFIDICSVKNKNSLTQQSSNHNVARKNKLEMRSVTKVTSRSFN